MYDSDMALYLKGWVKKDPAHLKTIQGNIDQMKAWAADGK